jgi:hypothetical protein
MTPLNVLELQQLNSTPVLPGCWKLMPGQVISLRPREAGALHITQGKAWATFDGPHGAHGIDSGDLCLVAGQALAVRAGQRLVFEPLDRDQMVCFEWTPLSGASPLRDLAQALSMAGGALLRLAGALAGGQSGLQCQPGPRRHQLG